MRGVAHTLCVLTVLTVLLVPDILTERVQRPAAQGITKTSDLAAAASMAFIGKARR